MRNLSYLLVAVVSFLCAGSAAAQLSGSHLEPGKLYLSLQGNGAFVDIGPTRRFIGVGPVSADPVDGEDSVWGGGMNAALGWTLPANYIDLGSNFRVVVGGRWFGGDAHDDFSFLSSDTGYIVAVDGSTGVFGDMGSDGVGEVELEFQNWGVDLLVATDFGEDVVFSPFIGFTYSGAERDEGLVVHWDDGGFTTIRTNHDLDTHSYGAAMGVTASIPLGNKLVLSITGRADLMSAEAEIDATGSSFLGTFSSNDEATDFAARMGGSVRLSYPLGPLRIGLEGFGSWLSWAPHPTYPAGTSGFPTSPLQLDDSEWWNVGGGLQITVPFEAIPLF